MKYGFIGCGNMGGALASALAKVKNDTLLCDINIQKAEELAARLNCKTADVLTIAGECNAIFLAVKPQSLEQTLAPLKEKMAEKKPLIITMAAGVKIEKIEKLIGCKLPVIRIMPNTPVAVGKGLILYCCNEFVSKEQLDCFVSDMRFSGALEEISEDNMDIGCAVSGCGPAYMYMFADAIAKEAVKNGLSEEQAIRFAALTMSGAAEMLLQSEKSAEELRIAVCSPGGSTIEGVKSLENDGFNDTVGKAIKAAYNRNVELGK